MKKLETAQMEKISGGIFWGYGENRCSDVTNGAGTVLYQWCCADYYVLWINVSTDCGVGPDRLQMY